LRRANTNTNELTNKIETNRKGDRGALTYTLSKIWLPHIFSVPIAINLRLFSCLLTCRSGRGRERRAIGVAFNKN